MTDAGAAWIFPGQGSQEAGMGRDLYDSCDASRQLFEQADQVLGRALSTLCFEGPDAELSLTFNAQPAIYITSLACLAAARAEGVLGSDPLLMAGHSLGEYTALAAAGALDFEAGLRLVEERGRLTQAAAEASPGGMAALLGLDEEAANAVCTSTGTELCNLNSPGQVVIGGPKEALERACSLALERGAKRAIPLDVGGAFHTSLMQPAVEPMSRAVAEAGLRSPRVEIIANDSALPMSAPDVIARELVYQLTHPVRWVQCVEFMASNGVSEFIEIGPGRVLTGLVKRIALGATTTNINGMKALSR